MGSGVGVEDGGGGGALLSSVGVGSPEAVVEVQSDVEVGSTYDSVR